ncbi:MAG: hypothetical protein RBS05_21640 [Zoogloea oleivorans]|uniref:hypothetical protein n=1 Tax=Zoogloea oleivorans TaxID=1552750 RepID=UPI002A3595F3|nr:hypothetical protein [Zoogloea oleivorans]MDY0038516.1 hypothetical protein [Zoogloea oleivorans]
MMASSNAPQSSRPGLPCANPCPRCAATLNCDKVSRDMDLESMPDEIDLLQVLWSQIRSYCNEFAPGPRAS